MERTPNPVQQPSLPPKHTHACAHTQGTSGVVPHTMVGELHSVRVLRFLKVLVGVPADVAAASDVSADQANPEILRREREKKKKGVERG